LRKVAVLLYQSNEDNNIAVFDIKRLAAELWI